MLHNLQLRNGRREEIFRELSAGPLAGVKFGRHFTWEERG